jgi:hypothetical protein
VGELAPLRPILADILDGLAIEPLENDDEDVERSDRLSRGAETLRWTHDFDEVPNYGERDELERLRDFVRGVEDILGEKGTHPGHRLKAVVELIADVD